MNPLDKNTFTRKILECESTMYHMAKSVLIQDADCEDAVQDAILTAYEKLHTLKDEAYFKTWLIRILLNICYQKKRKQQVLVSYEEYFAEEPSASGDYRELYEAIIKLPEKIRVTVVLFYVEGYQVEEIKQILKIPSGTVKSRLAKGRKLLKKELTDMEVAYGIV